MRAAGAVQSCIIGTTAVGLTATAEAAFAQSAADPAVIEQLQAVIQQQQRELEEQRRQMEEQQRVLDSLQQQVQQIERSAAEAQQAASAAGAKVDAQVAPGPSAEPVVTPRQPELELSISGQINRAVNVLGDGDGTEVTFVGNDVSNSRIRFVGTARATDDLTLATNIELGISPNNSSDVSQDNEDAGDFFDERKVEVYADHTALGRLWLGKGSTASDDTAEYDLSGVDVIMYSGVADIVGAVQFRQDDGGDLSGIRVDDAFFNGAAGGGAEQRLELGEGELDRVQVRAVGRQVEELGARGLDRRAHARDLVRAEIVQHDDVARTQRRHERLLDVGQKRAPLIAPSKTQGAVIPLWRSAAKNVVVFQWPWGTAATTRAPRRARP
jgi:hypothetical protein